MNLSPQLEEIGRQLAAASQQWQALCAGMTAARLAERPEPQSWSVGECLAHLTLTADGFLPRLRDALEQGRAAGVTGDGPYRLGLMSRWFAWVLEPPYRLRVKTGPGFVPRVPLSPETVLADFLGRQKQLTDLLPEAAGLALDRLHIQSPFSEKVRYIVYASFCFITAHERRHLWQAERARQRLARA